MKDVTHVFPPQRCFASDAINVPYRMVASGHGAVIGISFLNVDTDNKFKSANCTMISERGANTLSKRYARPC